MKSVLLAGGLGVRLRPLTYTIPEAAVAGRRAPDPRGDHDSLEGLWTMRHRHRGRLPG